MKRQPKRGELLQHPLKDHRGRHPLARVVSVHGGMACVEFTDTGVTDRVALRGWTIARRKRRRKP